METSVVLLSTAVAFAVFLALAFVNVPIAISMALGGMSGLLAGGFPLRGVPVLFNMQIADYAWLSIPIFIVLGELLSNLGVAEQIVILGNHLSRHIRGATSHLVALTGLVLGGMTGSIIGEASMLTKMFRRDLERVGHSRGYLVGLISSVGLLAGLVPPSNILLVAGLAGEISILRLWLGGIGAGVVIALCIMGTSIIYSARARRKGSGVGADESGAAKGKPEAAMQGGLRGRVALLKALPGLGVPVIIIVGMRMGATTPIEAGVVAIMYGLIVSWLMFRERTTVSAISSSLSSGLSLGANYLFMAAGAGIFMGLFVHLNLANLLGQWVASLQLSWWMFMALMLPVGLGIGVFISAVPMILVFVPLLLPAAVAAGVDPVHFGVSFVLWALLGAVSPPEAVELLFVCRLFDCDLRTWWREGRLFFGGLMVGTIIVSFVPQVVLFIPNLIGGR